MSQVVIRQLAAMVFAVGAWAACGSPSSQTPDAGPNVPDAAPPRPDAVPRPDAGPVPDSIDGVLDSIHGLSFEEYASEYPGYRLFVIELDQPVDHGDPDGKQLRQRIVLHHRSDDAPTVLYTTGYSLFWFDYLSELAVAMGANQLSTEQRFFADSRPPDVAPSDWQFVTIEQAATDHHRVVEEFARFYTGPWISTGHSKGGMTSVYHRRFFPDDVDATVAYVSPISFGAPDPRYLPFFDSVATAGCRSALRTAQLEALARFPAMLERAQIEAADQGLTFERSGGQAAAFEGEIAGMEWSFWQYSGVDLCGGIPGTGVTDDALYEFVRDVAGIGTDDWRIGVFETYYYQALYQLGYPSSPYEHLDGLLQYGDVPGDYYPDAPLPDYDPGAMLDIAQWVESEGSGILFVYGEYDPWYAGAFDPGGAPDVELVVAPRANHGALLTDLSPTDLATALDAIERWTGERPNLAAFAARAIRRPPMLRVPPPPRLPR